MIRSWKAQRDYLCELIKQVAEVNGVNGVDERDWLRAYALDVINLYKYTLDVPIACFEALIIQAKDCGWIKPSYKPLVPSMAPGCHLPLTRLPFRFLPQPGGLTKPNTLTSADCTIG